MRTVIGLFNDPNEARNALDELLQLGFVRDRISVVTEPNARQALEGRTSLHLGTWKLSDVGIVAAAGPVGESLGRAGAGGLSLSALLQQIGLSPELAAQYAGGVRRGQTLESLIVDDAESDRVMEVMQRHAVQPRSGDEDGGARPTEQRQGEPRQGLAGKIAGGVAAAGAATAGTAGKVGTALRGDSSEGAPGRREEPAQAIRETGGAAREIAKEATQAPLASEARKAESRIEDADASERSSLLDEERTIPIVREEIRVGKRPVARGGVSVAVHVTERPVSEAIHLRETTIEIERRPVDRQPSADEAEFKDGVVEMTESAEELVVSKEARVVEEIIVHKHVVDRTETIAGSVRETTIDVAKLRAFNPADFRSHFEGKPSSAAAATFEGHLPAYRFGHELHQSNLPSDRWDDIEATVQERWERKQPGTWDKFKDAIRYGWARARSS